MKLNGIRLFKKGSIAAALAAVLAVSGAEADVLRIGVATAGGGDPVTFSGSPLGIVRNQQLLEKAFAGTGTEVQWFFFKGAGPAVNEAFSNQQLDFAYQGDLPAVVGRSNGLDTKLLAALGVRANLYLAVPKGSPLKTIEDLKGKKVAIFRGTNGHLVMINLLAEHGLTERDIKAINLDTGSSQAALISNGVDAAFGGRELFKLRDKGLIDIIYDNPQQDVRYTRQTALVVRGEYEKEHPDKVQKVVDTLVDAAKWTSDESHRDDVFAEWAKSNDPADSLRADFTGVPLRDRASPLVDNFLISRYQAVADQAKEEKLIRRPVSIDGWFESSYLQKALKAKGLENYWTPYGPDGKQPAGNAVAATTTSKQGS
ncbi:ABC transporter substrate-binding protein [Pseudomonas sp. V98_8]|jgi:sulfonate transport system substrate-binding protein|uniref:ABC transporter substrate-binding protein n=1 Tax=Pseudomonas TaxID=286 RepID=UPI00249ED086|nr:ABC transporter substrate-binding protein [Pseudomonas sp. V98_8]MDI3393716.1 ABC transporter substrate-binding protein [Pseudomonas sp. V98_8]MDP9689878.1 sulfonate transport system substrate-binding protein [Pseudomonas mohnii]